MREWILANALAEADELNDIEEHAKQFARESKQKAWEKYINPIKELVASTINVIQPLVHTDPALKKLSDELGATREPMRRDVMKTLDTVLDLAENDPAANAVRTFYTQLKKTNADLYNSYLYNNGPKSALRVPVINPYYTDDAPLVNGYEVLNKYFDELFTTNNKVIAFGEDLGNVLLV